MKLSQYMIKLLAVCFLSCFNIVQSQWSILIYADPVSEITEAVLKNINDVVQSYSLSEVQIYVQLREYISKDPHKSYAWRYKVHDNCLEFVESVNMAEDFYTDVTSAMQWAYDQVDETTNHFGLLFSGHGCGILEPKAVLPGDELDLEPDDAQCQTCNRYYLRIPKRSILLNDITGKSVDNQTMIKIMDFGTSLISRKFDLVGFDLCLGSMIEHAYQLAPYVHYLVGYQHCASVEGFDYATLADMLQEDDECTPKALARFIVASQEAYSFNLGCGNKDALSALDCKAAHRLAESLDAFAVFCMDLMGKNPELAYQILAARKASYNACFVPMYTDVKQVVTQIAENISVFLDEDELVQLDELVCDVCNKLDHLVLETYMCEDLSDLCGVNIYFPYSHIDSSYYRVPFAQDCMWLDFLEMVLDANSGNSWNICR